MPRRAGRREQLVDQRRFDGQLELHRPERDRQPQRGRDHRQQLAIRAGEDGPRATVVRPRCEDRRGPVDVVGRGRREDEAPGRVRAGADDLREALHVVLDQPNRPIEDRRRTAVVRLEVDPQEARQRLVGEAEQSAHVREPPAIDRLVVVADEEDPVRGCGEEEGQPELRPIEVLGLVDEQMRAAGSPVGEDAGSPSSRRSARATRSSKSSPPRRRISASYAANVRATGPASGSDSIAAGSMSRSSLKRDRIVSRRRRSAPVASGRTARRTSSRSTSGSTRSPAVAQHLQPEGVERPDPHALGEAFAERREGSADPLAQLLRGALVERDRADRFRRRRPRRSARRSGRRASSSSRSQPGRRRAPVRAARLPPAAGRPGGVRAVRQRQDDRARGAVCGRPLTPGSSALHWVLERTVAVRRCTGRTGHAHAVLTRSDPRRYRWRERIQCQGRTAPVQGLARRDARWCWTSNSREEVRRARFHQASTPARRRGARRRDAGPDRIGGRHTAANDTITTP